MNGLKRLVFAGALGVVLFANTAQADVIVRWSENDSLNTVVANYSGTLDLTGYSLGIFTNNISDFAVNSLTSNFFGNVPLSTQTHYQNFTVNAYVDSGLDAHRSGSGLLYDQLQC